MLDYFSPSKRKQSDESSTTSGNGQSSTTSSEYVSHASCSSTAHTSMNTDDTVASESSTEFSQCTNTRAQHVAKSVHYMKTIAAELLLLCSQQETGFKGT